MTILRPVKVDPDAIARKQLVSTFDEISIFLAISPQGKARAQDYTPVESFTKSILHFVRDNLFLWMKADPVLGSGTLALFPIGRVAITLYGDA